MKVEFCRCGGVLLPAGEIMRCRNCDSKINKQASVIVTEYKKDIVIIEDNQPAMENPRNMEDISESRELGIGCKHCWNKFAGKCQQCGSIKIAPNCIRCKRRWHYGGCKR